MKIAVGIPKRVSSDQVREHLVKLSKNGIGYRAVAAAASVSKTTLFKIRSGIQATLNLDTKDRILSVDEEAVEDGAKIDAGPTRAMLQEIRSFDLTWEDIAHYLDVEVRWVTRLQKRKRVLARTEYRVRKVLKQVREDYGSMDDVPPFCPNCSVFHYNGICPEELASYCKKQFPTPKSRQELLSKIIPSDLLKAMSLDDVQDLRNSLPRLYKQGRNNGGYRSLHRDLTAIGYVSTRKPRKREEF